MKSSSLKRISFLSTWLIVISVLTITIIYSFYSSNFLYHQIFRPQLVSTLNLRVCCFILTTPRYFLSRAKAVENTWGPRCDRHVFISELSYSNMTEEQREYSKLLPIAPIANLSSGYRHLTEKSMLAFSFVHQHYANVCQWFVKSDDDTYLIVDHLKLFLSKQNSSEPVTFGFTLNDSVPHGFHSGGASYVLSREALKRLATALNNATGPCQRNAPSEDVEIARCLRLHGVYPGRSLDEKNLEMFHPLTFIRHFTGQIPADLIKYAEHRPQTSYNCCSDHSISFHYVSPEEQYLMDFFLYRARSPVSQYRQWLNKSIGRA